MEANLDFRFAFNNMNFSDRVLIIVIEQADNIEFSSTRKEGEDAIKDIEVRTMQISSPVLAAKSPFFLKLFSNGMKESQERSVTLRIHSSEEVAFVDLLNFMYSNTLLSATHSSLVDVLMVADKFQVSSCIRYCINLLCNLPMTCELAWQYLHLPSTVLMLDEVQPLADAANKYLAHCVQNFSRFEEEVIKLPLAGIEAILSNDDLRVESEDVLYEFVLKWAKKHYPVIENRREILTTKLASLIRFEFLTVRKLKQILKCKCDECSDFDAAYASKVVPEALIFKAESIDLHTFHASRPCTDRPVKVLEFAFPHPNFIVYLDLRKEECANLLPSQKLCTKWFRLEKKWFRLTAEYKHSDSFGLFVGMNAEQSCSCSVDYKFSARSKPTEEFIVQGGLLTDTLSAGGESYGMPNLFGVSWSQFIAPDSIYFINDVLYLKVEIRIKS